MKIAYCHAYPHQNFGAQRVTEFLAETFTKSGFPVVVLVPADGPFVAALRGAGIEVRVVAVPKVWRRYGGFLSGWRRALGLATLPLVWVSYAAVLRRVRPDVVHINDHRGMLLAGVPARLCRAAVVWHLHGNYPSRVVTLFGAWLSRRIVCVSRATRDGQTGLARFTEKTCVIHNSLLSVSAPRVRSERVRGRVLCVARFHPAKGLDDLITAAGLFGEKWTTPLHLRIIGGAQKGYLPYAASLRQKIRQLDLEETIEMVDFMVPIAEEFRRAEVYVQPSTVESFGLAILDAMNSSTPVVITDVGGMREIVRHGANGLVVPPQSPVLLAEAIHKLMVSHSLRDRLATQALTDVNEKFLPSRLFHDFRALYESAMKG